MKNNEADSFYKLTAAHQKLCRQMLTNSKARSDGSSLLISIPPDLPRLPPFLQPFSLKEEFVPLHRVNVHELLMAMRMEVAAAHADAILNDDSLDVARNVLGQLCSCGVHWG